jgi:hypothetical protein
MKYNIGDVVQLSNIWDNLYGIIVDADYDADNDMKYPVYRIIVQGNPEPKWLSEVTIVRKIE